ncbi:insulin-degrading enzyme isoform X2 [Orussus abietinus]|uniref:insulin-degrading enzyme isoform X2 n=1 Tax=Orussus abietinus TaxID=222816 RepID=UPI000626A6D8|nr:insulin-degrading enzyme isoform X2 [Orussus abietinus]
MTTRNNFEVMASQQSQSHGHTSARFDNIVKSPNDTRTYRGLILNNKMKVLLISDSKTDKSAAALNVNIGYLSDPPNLPGLAHFCEHMLFLGTKKYPEENEYSAYLSQNGGHSNAVTDADHATYEFDVSPDKLQEALDRFSQFFIEPLFSEAMTEREMCAINSEHEKNISNDIWRLDQLEKSTAKTGHVYSKFGTGNRETLSIIPQQQGVDVRKELFNFYETWYSANIMALSVLGKESLDELETMVSNLFSKVKNKDVEAPIWKEHPFDDNSFQSKWYMVPVKNIRKLNIFFPLPYLHEYYKSLPENYISHLIGHEGKGSLLSCLKAKGWCNTLAAGKRSPAKEIYFFGVYIDLTEEGMNHIDDIIALIFQYINVMKQEGPLQWIFNEFRDIAAMNFRFKEKLSARSYVNSTVLTLQHYPIEEVLVAQRLFFEWRPDLIDCLMESLTPDKIRVYVIAQQYENIAIESESWYGTKYTKEKVTTDILNKWKNAGINNELQLPAKNEFIPTKFDIKPHDSVDKFPVIIEDTPLFRVWFKQDDEFLVPKATLTFNFVSPLVYIDPHSYNHTYMFVQLLRDSLNEYAYNAELAGLKWEITLNRNGFAFGVGGYNDKQNVLLEKIMNIITHLEIDPKRFNILKENYIRALKNFEAEQPYQHSLYYMIYLLNGQAWGREKLLDACSQLTVERTEQFISQFLGYIHIECLLHGNITKREALEVVKLVETKLTSSVSFMKPVLSEQLLPWREVKLDDGCHFLYETTNHLHKCSCTLTYYQSGLQSTKSNMLLELLVQIIKEPCFNTLRTQEQLGYIVSCSIQRSNGVQGLKIIVQSDSHPQYVEERIDAFTESMLKYITNMSEEEFNKHKESLATIRLEKPKMMSVLSAIFWSEIYTQEYNFDKANIEVAYLRTISHAQIVEFMKDVVYDKSPMKRKMSVHVISMAEGGAGLAKKPESASKQSKIEDMVAFKASQSFYPLLKPFNNIPRKGRSKL